MDNIVIFLLVIIFVLIAAVVYLIVSRPKVVEISDTLPETKRLRDCWLKLQNEGKRYLRISDGRVYLKVINSRRR